ncbi:MAG: UDP-N-acetylmuramoyl-L-alanine--D-glutamate ligase [Candidatus Paceibacterota bacterium]
MANYRQYFKGKKITVMGLGLLGRGIGVVKFLAENGADLLVTDLKTKKELAPAVRELSNLKNIKFVFGKHRLADFADRDLVIRAANVPPDSPYLAEARKNNIPIKMDASLFVSLAPKITTVGITGTRGKSTVTHLLHQIIDRYLKGRPKDRRRLHLGGNVRGVATLPLLKKVKAGDIVVMELDSWQLQGFGEEEISPTVAVFTNLMPDHLNYYRGDMKRYFADKKNIYRFQTAKDYLIVGKSVSPLIRKSGRGRGQFCEAPAVSWPTKLLGRHNQDNISLAVAAARTLKIPDRVIKQAVADFSGVPGRLELVGEAKEIKYYNDTTATVPEATLAALAALADYAGRIILIGGGSDKLLDYRHYGQEVPTKVKKLILFPGSATDKIKKVLPAKFRRQTLSADNMTMAVKLARAEATAGDVILLSPAAASFGLFTNEFDRGEQFNKLIKKTT